jgi:hypothetical protein
MKQKLLLIAVALTLTFVSNAQKLNKLSKEERKAGWELLFNGKNLNGWKIFQGGEVKNWKVSDGILSNSGVGSDYVGDIITKKEFQDFELYLEWKITPKSNSGIFIRAKEGVAKKIYETAPEYQLLDDKGRPGLDAAQYTGANYAMDKPVGAEVKPLDQWNVTRIIVNGSNVKHFLNGKKVVEYDFWTEDWKLIKSNSKWKNAPHYGMAKKGHIGIQDHGGLTQFRNIKIKKL